MAPLSAPNREGRCSTLPRTRLLGSYELEKPVPGWIGGMPVSSDGRWLFLPQLDEQSSNLMMIENWH